jgi:hypothetical protein
MANNLSDTARTILATAAARSDLHLLPLPVLKTPPVIVRKTIGMLIQTGLIAEVPAGPGEPVWAQAEGSTRVTLLATAAGLAAIGIPSEPTTPEKPVMAPASSVIKLTKGVRRGMKTAGSAATSPNRAQAARAATSGAGGPSGGSSKQDTCIALLRRENGASISEMMTATGWQAHSVRGFMSGALKKRLGLNIISEKDERGVRRYYIAALRAPRA